MQYEDLLHHFYSEPTCLSTHLIFLVSLSSMKTPVHCVTDLYKNFMPISLRKQQTPAPTAKTNLNWNSVVTLQKISRSVYGFQKPVVLCPTSLHHHLHRFRNDEDSWVWKQLRLTFYLTVLDFSNVDPANTLDLYAIEKAFCLHNNHHIILSRKWNHSDAAAND